MNDITQDLQNTVRRSGVSYAVVSHLADVGRVTLYLWRKTKRNPHRRTVAPVARVLHALNAAVDAGDLPLPNTITSSAEKLRRVTEVCKRHGL